MTVRHNFASRTPLLAAASALVLLAACGEEKKEAVPGTESDPALTGALGDQIMVDPDLAQQNRGNAAVSGGGPAAGEIPAEKITPEAAEAARAEAAAISGGKLQPAPAPAAGDAATRSGTTAEQVAPWAFPGAAGGNCAGKAEYTMSWAARMPTAFPVYPRAHVQEAAGTDKDGCKLRVVNFVSPVAVDDMLSFYATRARIAGFAVANRKDGKDSVLSGTKGNSAYVVYVRKLDSGLTETDLVTNGG